jgi:hypothetical protein
MDELQLAGVQVITIYGNVEREPGEIILAAEVKISIPDEQTNKPVDDVVAVHDAPAAMAAERATRLRIEQNAASVGEKMRAFYKDTVGLTDEEIDDANLLEMLIK